MTCAILWAFGGIAFALLILRPLVRWGIRGIRDAICSLIYERYIDEVQTRSRENYWKIDALDTRVEKLETVK